MTLLKQLEALATGSNLLKNFKKLRLALTVLISLVLSLLLLLSGLNSYETTKSNFEAQRIKRQNNYQSLQLLPVNPNFSSTAIDNIRVQEEAGRQAFLDKVSQDILINNIILLIFLILLSWFSLYFLLLPLSKSQKEKDEFLAHASHELRTPLAILYSQLSLSKNEKNLKEIQNSHKEALIEIKRLQNLSNTLLSELSQNDKTWEFENVKVVELIQEILNKLEPLNDRKISFDLNYSSELDIKTNYTKFYQLIFNLLDNSLKYASKNSTLNLSVNSKKIVFENKTGVDNFKPGIGLGICKKISFELGFKLDFNMKDKNFVVNLEV